MLTKFIVVIIFQYIHISKHHGVHPKRIRCCMSVKSQYKPGEKNNLKKNEECPSDVGCQAFEVRVIGAPVKEQEGETGQEGRIIFFKCWPKCCQTLSKTATQIYRKSREFNQDQYK